MKQAVDAHRRGNIATSSNEGYAAADPRMDGYSDRQRQEENAMRAQVRIVVRHIALEDARRERQYQPPQHPHAPQRRENEGGLHGIFHRQFPDMNLAQGDGQHLEYLEEVYRNGSPCSINELHAHGRTTSSTLGHGVESRTT